MVSGFEQLILLPDEIVRNSILSRLNWKDLAKLDAVFAHKGLQEHYSRWLVNTKRHVTLKTTASLAMCNWMVRRQMKVETLGVHACTSDKLLLEFPFSGLEVERLDARLDLSVTAYSMLLFLLSLRGLRSISAFSFAVDSSVIDTWNSLPSKHPKLERLQLHYYKGRRKRFTAEFVAQIAEHCKQLTFLWLHRCVDADDHSVVLLAQNCRQLESLHLDGSVILTDTSLRSLGQHCQHLRELYFDATKGRVSDDGLLCLLQRCRKLHSLHLWDCSALSDRSIVALGALVTQMTALALCNCYAFGSDTAETAMKQLTKLTSLNLNGGSNISEELLHEVIGANPGLHSLELNDVTTVTSEVIVTLVKTCSKLSFLHLNYCYNLTDVVPIGGCTSLALLTLRGCGSITDDQMLQLAATPGHQMVIGVFGSGVTALAGDQLRDSARVRLDFGM